MAIMLDSSINDIFVAFCLTAKEHVTLTDNNSFVVYVQCWEDGLKDWHAVVPLHKKLSDDSKAAILKHVQDLGFDAREDIYFAKYDNCMFDD